MKLGLSLRWQSALALLASIIVVMPFSIKMLRMQAEITEVEDKIAHYTARAAVAKGEAAVRVHWIRARKEEGRIHSRGGPDALRAELDQQLARFGTIQTRPPDSAPKTPSVATDASVLLVPISQKLETLSANLIPVVDAMAQARPGVFATKIVIRPSELLPDQNVGISLDGFALQDP